MGNASPDVILLFVGYANSVLQERRLLPICPGELRELLQYAGKCGAEISAGAFQKENHRRGLSSFAWQQ